MTYSIAARDERTGELGVAVQSHWFSVGSLVTWGETGVGVVATQAFAERSYGPLGLDAMREGSAAPGALAALLAADEGAERRQVAMVDAAGAVGVHTGSLCLAGAGHVSGDGFSVQANMMLRDTVPDAMAAAFVGSSGDLTSRLLAALDAAEAEGGDVRGRQSAAILIVGAQRAERPALGQVTGRLLEVRVDDHPDPLVELRRLVEVAGAYRHMNDGDEHFARSEIDAATASYDAAQRSVPDNVEFTFWCGVALARLGRIDDARELLARAYDADHGHWRELLRRLPAGGLLSEDVVGELLR